MKPYLKLSMGRIPKTLLSVPSFREFWGNSSSITLNYKTFTDDTIKIQKKVLNPKTALDWL